MKRNPLHDELIDRAEVQRLMGGPGRGTIRKHVRENRLPAPLELGDQTLRWWRGEVMASLAALPRKTYRAPDEPEPRTPRPR